RAAGLSRTAGVRPRRTRQALPHRATRPRRRTDPAARRAIPECRWRSLCWLPSPDRGRPDGGKHRVVTLEPKDAPKSERRRAELGKFLRTRRARLSPADFDMPAGSRRRTPGLRREELALLAGVGVTWYTWLEQGREINVSTQVLDALARTLRLDRAERWHMYVLAEAVPVAVTTRRCSVPDTIA